MPENNDNQLIQLRKIIKEMVEQALLDEKSKRIKKRGGGLTDTGALKRVDFSAFMANARNALANQDGDVKKAAKEVGVSTRTFYGYLEDEEKLQKVKDHIDDEVEKKEETQEKAQEKVEEKSS